MKVIIISIRPEWACAILNEEKILEIRKTIPKCELPIEVYIYVTKAKPYLFKYFFNGDNGAGWNFETSFCKEEFIDDSPTLLNGKVVASFELNNVEEIACETLHNGISEVPIYYTDSVDDLDNSENNACVSNQELIDYFGIKKGGTVVGFAWHIENLEILSKPMELSDFGLKKAPQSWCYVEVE